MQCDCNLVLPDFYSAKHEGYRNGFGLYQYFPQQFSVIRIKEYPPMTISLENTILPRTLDIIIGNH